MKPCQRKSPVASALNPISFSQIHARVGHARATGGVSSVPMALGSELTKGLPLESRAPLYRRARGRPSPPRADRSEPSENARLHRRGELRGEAQPPRCRPLGGWQRSPVRTGPRQADPALARKRGLHRMMQPTRLLRLKSQNSREKGCYFSSTIFFVIVKLGAVSL